MPLILVAEKKGTVADNVDLVDFFLSRSMKKFFFSI
jgi:hypothetical protein